MHLRAVAEQRLEAVGELLQEGDLGDLAALHFEERVVAVGLGGRLHPLAEDLGGDPGLVLEGHEGLDQRRGQDAAEVGDHRLDLVARAQPSSRTSS